MNSLVHVRIENTIMNREEIVNFEKVSTQLNSFYTETAILVKKAPKEEMNLFKIKLINEVLQKANDILGGMKPFEDFSEFDLVGFPNNGDVAMILGQYISCLEEIRKDNAHIHSGFWFWDIDGEENSNDIRIYISVKYKRLL